MEKQARKRMSHKKVASVVVGALVFTVAAGSFLNALPNHYSADTFDEGYYNDAAAGISPHGEGNPEFDAKMGGEFRPQDGISPHGEGNPEFDAKMGGEFRPQDGISPHGEGNPEFDAKMGGEFRPQDGISPHGDSKGEIERTGKELTREFSRLEKRVASIVKRLNQRSERIDKFMEKVGTNKQFTNLKAEIKASLNTAEDISASLSKLSSTLDSDIKAVASMSAAWDQLSQFQDPYWMRRDTMDMRINSLEMMDQVWDFKMEQAKLVAEYAKVGADLPSEVLKAGDNLDQLLKVESKAKALDDQVKQEVQKINSIADADQLRSALDDLQSLREDIQFEREDLMDEFQLFDWEELRRGTEAGWQGLQKTKMSGNFAREVEGLAMKLKDSKEFINRVSSLGIPELKAPVERLSTIVEKGGKLLEEMKANDGADMDQLWKNMDEIGKIAEKEMEKIFKVLEKNPKNFKDLEKEFGKVDKFRDFKNEDVNFEDDWNYDQFDNKEQKNLDKLKDQLRAEVRAEVMRQVGDNIIAELAPILGNAGAEKVVGRVMNKMDVFGERGNDLLGSYAAVSQKVSEMDENSYDTDIKALIKEVKEMIPVPSLEEDFVAMMEKIRKTDREGAKALVSELKALLAKNDELSTKGDEAYQFADVRLNDDAWYFEHVIKLKNDGYVSGYKDANGNLTGEFGPGNDVTLAEVLKMAYEGSGEGGASGSAKHGAANGHWSQKYVVKAEQKGLDQYIDLSNIERPATREEVAVIIGEAYKLVDKAAGCENPFSDYKGKYTCHLESAKEHGVFTGTGEGLFEGNRSINRAEVSKVINVAIGEASENDLMEELAK